jgi:hypothetical protein
MDSLYKPDRSDLWTSLTTLMTEWHSPLVPDDGVALPELEAASARLGVPLPRALMEFYGLIGRRLPLAEGLNAWVAPEHLTVEGVEAYDPQLRGDCLEEGLIPVYLDMPGHGTASWAIRVRDLPLPDPPVILVWDSFEKSEDWIAKVQNDSFSQVALQALTFETLYSAIYAAEGHGSTGAAIEPSLERLFGPVSFPHWHWPAWPARFFRNAEILLVAAGEDAPWVRVAAKSERALSRVRRELDVNWSL